MRNVLGVIHDRHSSRVTFDPNRPVPADDLWQVLEAARWAPTAHNMQNFDVVVVDDPGLLGQLGGIESHVSEEFIRENYAQLSFSDAELFEKRTGLLASHFPPAWLDLEGRPWESAEAEHSFLGGSLRGAPVLLVVVYDPSRRAPASEGDALGLMSLGCVLENMWLAAQDRGIGFQVLSVLSGDEVEPEICRILEIPPTRRVAVGARLGYPLETPPPVVRVRREVADFAHRNSYRRLYATPPELLEV